jgi:hypothetical protein
MPIRRTRKDYRNHADRRRRVAIPLLLVLLSGDFSNGPETPGSIMFPKPSEPSATSAQMQSAFDERAALRWQTLRADALSVEHGGGLA